MRERERQTEACRETERRKRRPLTFELLTAAHLLLQFLLFLQILCLYAAPLSAAPLSEAPSLCGRRHAVTLLTGSLPATQGPPPSPPVNPKFQATEALVIPSE